LQTAEKLFVLTINLMCNGGWIISIATVYTAGTESVETPLKCSLFVSLQPFAKIKNRSFLFTLMFTQLPIWTEKKQKCRNCTALWWTSLRKTQIFHRSPEQRRLSRGEKESTRRPERERSFTGWFGIFWSEDNQRLFLSFPLPHRGFEDVGVARQQVEALSLFSSPSNTLTAAEETIRRRPAEQKRRRGFSHTLICGSDCSRYVALRLHWAD